MKRHLILCALAAGVYCHAGMDSAGAAKRMFEGARPVAVTAPAATVKPEGGPRHLSEAERAELRRQLEQFNRQYGKHP